MIEMLPLGDVEQIVRLLGCVSDPNIELSLPDRKRLLAEGLRDLIDADVFIWSSAVMNDEKNGEVGPTRTIDGGWSTDLQRQIAFGELTNPAFTSQAIAPMLQVEGRGRCMTKRREDYLDDATWEIVGEGWRKSGLNHALLTTYSLPPPAFSAVGFHRLGTKPPFSERDKAVVNVILGQVDWLHRHGMNHEAGTNSLMLAPRERQTLLYLLEGKSKKEIALVLTISEHTVGDYVKRIYKQFEVSSHPELQAIFLIGNTP